MSALIFQGMGELIGVGVWVLGIGFIRLTAVGQVLISD
jgi:hypothetical protein